MIISQKLSNISLPSKDKRLAEMLQNLKWILTEDVKLRNAAYNSCPHYIETAAYNSCPQFLRGGCLAAFDVSRMIVLVAEMQSEKDTRILRNISERIRENVYKNEIVDIGKVVLVKSASVPKTTSGKIQRGLAKEKFVGGKMNVLMEIKFDNSGGLLQSSHGGGQRRGRNREGEEGRAVIVEEKEAVLYSLSSAPTGVSRL